MSSTKRRQFTPEFKASAVALVLEKGQSIPQVARDLDLVDSVFRRCIDQAKAAQVRRTTRKDGQTPGLCRCLLTPPDRASRASET